jgi:hypothetical protein
MEELFEVHPRESFLLGLSSGEYEAKREVAPQLRFASVIRNRLLSWLPTFDDWPQNATIEPDELPDDIDWTHIASARFGYANSQPDCCFVQLTDTIVRRRWLPAKRRSLLELLIPKLAPFMQFSLRDHWELGNTHKPEETARAFHKWEVACFVEDPDSADAKCTGKEYPDAIQKALLELIEKGDRTLFDTGRCFGRIVVEFESFTSQAFDEEFEKSDAYGNLSDRLRDPVETLLGFNWIRQNHYAEQALQDMRWCLTDKSLSWDSSPQTLANRQLMNVWIAIGELLGVLRDVDVAARAEDAASDVPRAFMKDDSPDQVEKLLRMAELDLAEKVGRAGAPEYIVSSLKDDIETLTRLVWPNNPRDSVGSRIDLPSIWHDAIKYPATELHGRFASIALTLYRCYRKPGTHERDSFRCSYDEARFVVAGVRTLVDLRNQIADNNK